MRATCETHDSRDRAKKNNRSTMDQNRIEKLLAAEYTDFRDSILVESPFAETTRSGRGIRQVSLGLTPTKLIVAADILKGNPEFRCPRGLDPCIECFELISLYPLQCVNLSVYNRRHRKTLKARFIDGRTSYYELAGIQYRRDDCWRQWCVQLDSMLAKRIDGSSLSETTAASSSSSSTLYVLSSEIEIRQDPRRDGRRTVCRVWTHYGGAGDYAAPTWRQKDLYLGPSYNELLDGRYAPIPVRFAGASLEDIKDELKDLSPSHVDKGTRSWPTCHCYEDKRKSRSGLCDVLFIRERNRRYCNTSKLFATCQSCPCKHLQGRIVEDKRTEKRSVWYKDDLTDRSSTREEKQRVGEAASSPTKCLTRRISRFGFGVPEKCHSGLVLGPTRWERESYLSKSGAQNFHLLMENAVRIWEGDAKGRCKSARRCRHFRRYGVCAAPHFLYALGPWSVQPGERNGVPGARRSFSLVTIRRQPADPEMKLPVSRRQLAASISSTALRSGRFPSIGTAAKGRVVLFWTPEYWYRPRPAAAAYRELRRHLNHLRSYRQEKERPVKRKLFHRKKRHQGEEEPVILAEEKPSFLERIFSANVSCKRKKKLDSREYNSSSGQLRRLLRMDFRISMWDINSSILACQLTLIDRDLFLRIPTEELEVLVFQRSSRNAPNLAAWIAFSHRVSCLTASEILAVRKLCMRGRIVARLINAAKKCFAMGNFQSCRSILAGLQAPAIFRLRNTWTYLRIHHANRYEIMERLCKIYKSPYAAAYRRAWCKAERNPPSMPHVADLLARLLGLLNTGEGNSRYQANGVVRETNRPKDSPNGELLHANEAETESTRSNRDSERKQDTNGKGILASVLTRIKYRRDRATIYEERTDPSWTSRQQDLAWKYFHRWNNAILKRRARATERQRFRDMDPRLKRVLDVAGWLADCQKRARGYEFPGHSFTREFLLKTRYREDRENFFISLKIEPSTIT